MSIKYYKLKIIVWSFILCSDVQSRLCGGLWYRLVSDGADCTVDCWCLTSFITTCFNYNSSESVIHVCVIHSLTKVYCAIDIKMFCLKSCNFGKVNSPYAIIFLPTVCGTSYNSGPIYRMTTCLDSDIFIFSNFNVGFCYVSARARACLWVGTDFSELIFFEKPKVASVVKVPKFYGIITLRSVSHGLETASWPNIMLWV